MLISWTRDVMRSGTLFLWTLFLLYFLAKTHNPSPTVRKISPKFQQGGILTVHLSGMPENWQGELEQGSSETQSQPTGA